MRMDSPGLLLRSARLVAVRNLTGDRRAHNFSHPFNGTHFGPGRTVQVRLRATLR